MHLSRLTNHDTNCTMHTYTTEEHDASRKKLGMLQGGLNRTGYIMSRFPENLENTNATNATNGTARVPC